MKKPEPKPALLPVVEWLTLPEALRRVESETGEALSEGLLLQRAGDGAFRLALRLDHAKGTPWSGEAWIQKWWRVRFTELTTSCDVVTLSGIYDLDLDKGGRHVIDTMRRRANGDTRPASRATLLEPRVKLIDDSGASFALLCPATTQDTDGTGGTVISGTYCYASGLTWPAQFAGAELVVRSDELARITGGKPGAAPRASRERTTEPAASMPVRTASEPAVFELARTAAQAIIERQAAKDLYPSQSHIADEIASDFRKQKIFGPDGKPLAGATIKRHALKGISSANKKAQSTTFRRGK